MKFKFNLLWVIFLILSSCKTEVFYTIKDFAAGSDPDTYWVPFPGDSVLVKVVDKLKSPNPGILRKDDKSLIANFVYYDASTNHELTGNYRGLFCFKSDEGIKSKGSNASVLRTFDKEKSYAWSTWKGANCYNSYHNKSGKADWNWGSQSYSPSGGLQPYLFNFILKDAGGNETAVSKIEVVGVAGEVKGTPQACTQGGDATHLPRSQIFEYLFGMSESSFNTKYVADFASAFGKKGNGEYFIKNSINNKEFGCGKIDSRKFSEVEGDLKTIAKPANPQASLNVIFYEMSNPKIFKGIRKFRKFADVGAMQGRVENNDAVFQLASRPNGLEGGREFRGADFIDITGSHAVQGEEAAISAATGGIFRMFGDVPDAYFVGGQNLGMNFFKNIPTLGDKITEDGDVKFNIQLLDTLNQSGQWWDNLLICFHENIQVTTGFSCLHRQGDERVQNAIDCNELIPEDRVQIIHQIPVAALDLAHGLAAGKNWDKDPAAVTFSKNLLKAFYKGTIIASILHGKNKIFLTAVGAGAFKNNPEWVVEAIADCKELITAFGLKVYFVFMGFSRDVKNPAFPDGDYENGVPNDFGGILSLVKEIGGNYLKIRFNNSNQSEKAILMRYAGGNLKPQAFTDPGVLEPIFSQVLQNPRADIAGLPKLPEVKPSVQPEPKKPLADKGIWELEDGTYVVKNQKTTINFGTGGGGVPTKLLYEMDGSDAVMILKKKEHSADKELLIKKNGEVIEPNFNYVAFQDSPELLISPKGAFRWKSELPPSPCPAWFRIGKKHSSWKDDLFTDGHQNIYKLGLKDGTPEGASPDLVSYAWFQNCGKYNEADYDAHPFAFQLEKDGKTWVVDLNMTKKPQGPKASQGISPLQPQLTKLKTKLSDLKNKLENLSEKLGKLNAKLGGGKGGEAGKGKCVLQLPYLTLVDGSIIEQEFPDKGKAAIVNAANGALLGGGGIDGAIWKAVGEERYAPKKGDFVGPFKTQCIVLRRKNNKLKADAKNRYRGDKDNQSYVSDLYQRDNESSYVAGEAGLTQAFGALANNFGYVIHAVGPQGEHPVELRAAYQNSLDRANEAGLKVIAFCPISTGIFGYDINLATPVAINAIVDWVKKNSGSALEEIRLVTYSVNPNEYPAYKKYLEAETSICKVADQDTSIISKSRKLNESSKNTKTQPPLVFCIKTK